MTPTDTSSPFALFLESIEQQFRGGGGERSSELDKLSHESIACVHRLYADVTEDLIRSPRPEVELPCLREWLHADVVYDWFSPVLPPFVGSARGLEDVYARITRNFSAVSNQNPEMKRIIAQGSEVVVVLHETGVLERERVGYEADFVQILSLQDGKLARFQTYGNLEIVPR